MNNEMKKKKEKIIGIIDEEFCRYKVWNLNRTAKRIISLFESKKCVWTKDGVFYKAGCANLFFHVRNKNSKFCPYCGGEIEIKSESTETMLLSEDVLKKDWDNPTEDKAWENLDIKEEGK